jgi:rubrerythrin
VHPPRANEDEGKRELNSERIMAEVLTLLQVLERAIEKEIAAQRLYMELSEKAKDPAASRALRDVMRQEKGHQSLLEDYLAGKLKTGTLNPGMVVDYKIAETLEEPPAPPAMNLKDVFLMAARREKAAHELYLGLAQMHPAGEVRRTLDDLAAQELQHKLRVETLYTEVAFPQTDGG